MNPIPYIESDSRLISDAKDELIDRFITEPWLLNARRTVDDAGERLEVFVLDELYKEDVLPRRLGDCFLVVRRIKQDEQVPS